MIIISYKKYRLSTLNLDLIERKRGEKMFEIRSDFKPAGDQPQAIEKLVQGINRGDKFQTLLGVTGSRKNFHNGKCYTKNTETNINLST